MNAINSRGYQDVPMTRRRAQLLAEYANKLAEMLENAPDDQDLAEWVQSKIDRAAGAIQSAYHYLDQEDDDELEKAVGHKYTHRKLIGRDSKTGRARYRYYYAEHQGGGISRAKFEAGSAFKLTWKARRGHFHIDRVEGDQVFITHDSRPDMEPVAISKSELRALLKSQHGKAEQEHVEKRRKEVEKIKSKGVKRGLGLALHRLRQAAQVAGVELDERYQRKPKKKRAKVAETAREDRFETMPEVEESETSFQGAYERFLDARAELPKPRKGQRDTRGVDALRALSDQELKALNEGYKAEEEKLEQLKAKRRPLFDAYSKADLDLGAEIEEKTRAYRKLRPSERELKRRARAEIGELNRKREESNRAWRELIAQQKQEIADQTHMLINPSSGFGISGYSIEREIGRRLEERAQAIIEEATTPRNQLTETAQQIIEEANQDHEERHEEHQEITRYELGEHTHTKTGAKLYTAKQKERVERDEYFRRLEIAKKYKGRYERRYVRGFVFKTAEDARAFALEVEGAAQEAPETSAETVKPHEDHPSADNFETMPEVESARATTATVRDVQSTLKASRRADKLTSTGRRSRASINADKELIEAAQRALDEGYKGMESPAFIPLNERTPRQANYQRLKGALNGFKSSQTLTRGSWTDDHKSLQKKRIKARDQLDEALKELDQIARSQEQAQVSIEDLPPKGQRTLEDAKRFFGEPRKNTALKTVTYERDGHIVTGPASERGKGKFRYDLSLPRERFRNEPLLATAQSSNEIGAYDTLDEALTAAINQYEPSDQIIDRMIESEKEKRERTAQRMGVTPREQLAETAREVTQGADNFETMPEVEASAREQLIETAEQATAPSSPLNIDQANAQDTLTEDRTRSAESKAADKALIESARELAKTSERGEEIKSALVDLMNAQQLKRYKRATGDMSARAEDMIEKRREARERLRAATSGEVINNFETMPEVEAQPKKRPSIYTRSGMVSYNKVDSIMEGKTPSRLPLKTQAQFEKIESLIAELEQMEQRRTKSGRLKDWQGIKAKREEILNARRVLLQKYASERTRTQHSALQDHTFLSYYKPAKSTATPEEVRDKHGDRRSDLRTLRRYFETHEPDQQGQLTEAAETLDTRSTQQQTFTPEIQSAISSFKVDVGRRQPKSYPLETYLKTRKDGGIYRTSKTPEQLANLITGNLPDNIANLYDFGEDTLRALITRAINEGVEARETPAELKDRIGYVITKRFQDNAASQKAQITGEGQRKALIEMKRNIKTLSGDGYFNEYGRGGERSYMGLGAIEKTLDMSERLSDLYVDGIFVQALPPELERFKLPVTRFSRKAADEVAGAFANKYETVGEIRDNISTIKEQMRATIKRALDQTTDALVKRPTTLDLINQSYEKATERLNTDRQKNIENARALAQYTDDPQAHLAEIQELERQSDQAIAEQMEINREFADAYIHEASDLVDRVLETTKGEVIDNVMSVKTPKHADKFTATVRGKANQKLMARIFNEVFEQVRREIGDEPIERGEKHPRNIANTVKKPSKTPAQFRGDIERADEEKRARKLAEREARRARRTQKSANHLIDYRAQLLQTIERIA